MTEASKEDGRTTFVTFSMPSLLLSVLFAATFFGFYRGTASWQGADAGYFGILLAAVYAMMYTTLLAHCAWAVWIGLRPMWKPGGRWPLREWAILGTAMLCVFPAYLFAAMLYAIEALRGLPETIPDTWTGLCIFILLAALCLSWIGALGSLKVGKMEPSVGSIHAAPLRHFTRFSYYIASSPWIVVVSLLLGSIFLP